MLPTRGSLAGFVLVLATLAPRALGQPLPQQTAAPLPDLGGAGSASLSPLQERRLGESVMREIRAREPSYVEDPEVSEYLAQMGARLSAVMSGARYDFEFFVIRDPSINAFALPGGFVGVHTGLISTADTESELAAVLAHELSHVTQRHISRMFGQQEQMQIPVLAGLAAAIVLGLRRPDLAAGAIAATQGAAISASMGYSREFEREADRVGLDAMGAAGYDPRAMAVFFEKLQRATRIMDDGSFPSYLRSHPVTVERIADAQNKSEHMPYRQHLDSVDFYVVRAKLAAETGEPREAVARFEGAVRDKRYANEVAARYGLTSALLRAGRPKDAAQELERLLAAGGSGPMIETLGARVKRANGDLPGAVASLTRARTRYPQSRPVIYAYTEALQDSGRNKDAAAVLQAKTYAALGKRLLQHQSQAEYYVLQGSLPAAIEQLQLARAAGDGDFYQLSMIDARLKDLRAQHQSENPKK
jgi:predicted Zn-dependent protease